MLRVRLISSIVCGLGNPGPLYERTRHNAGFLVVDALARKHRVTFGKAKDGMCVAKWGDTLLGKPDTFMNLSGPPLQQVIRYYKVPLQRVLVVVDDVYLPVGKIRLARSGGHAGQKGVESIIQHVSSKDFPRLRIGVGSPFHGSADLAKYVLQNIPPGEMDRMNEAIHYGVAAIEMWLQLGIDKAMNEFN